MAIDVVVKRYHLSWVTFAGDFTTGKSSTLLVQIQLYTTYLRYNRICSINS